MLGKNKASNDSVEQEQTREPRKILSRRTLLRGALGMAGLATAYVVADQGLAAIVWGERKDEVDVLPEHQKFDSEDMWLVVPGLGVQSSFGYASTLRTSLEIAAPVAYLQYSDEGLSLDAIAHKVNKLCHNRKVKKLHLYGNSMGLPTALQLASRFDVQDLGTVIADGSPHDLDDAQDHELTSWVEHFVSVYPPGYLSKLMGESYNSTKRDPNNELSFLSQLKDAHRVTGEGVSPRVWADQLVLLHNVKPYEYADVVAENTKKAYIRPIEPANDDVVKVVQANGKYNDTFGQPMTTLTIDVTSHASPSRFPGQYNQALGKYLLSLHQTRRNPRHHGPIA